jgi:hypothetical protein
MRFLYLTTDEVDESLALELAQGCGVTLYPAGPRDTLAGRFDAVLCDWDSWPPARRGVLTAFLVGPPACPVAVHGHNWLDGQVEALRSCGIAVHDHLEGEVFRLLRRAVLARRDAGLTARDRGAPLATSRAACAAGFLENPRAPRRG